MGGKADIGHSPRARSKAATTIPIVFIVNEDPVRLGLVASLARPGGNLTGVNFFAAELAAKPAGAPARVGTGGYSCCRVCQPGQCYDRGVYVERGGIGCASHGATNPGFQDQYQSRDRCSLRYLRARAARCAFRRSGSIFRKPARAIGPLGVPARRPRDIWASRICRDRWADELWPERGGCASSGRCVHR